MPSFHFAVESEAELDELVFALESRIEESHEASCDEALDEDARDAATASFKAARRILARVDPENPIFDSGIKARVSFDWDEYWKGQEDDDGGDDGDQGDEPDTGKVIEGSFVPLSGSQESKSAL